MLLLLELFQVYLGQVRNNSALRLSRHEWCDTNVRGTGHGQLSGSWLFDPALVLVIEPVKQLER